MYSFLRRICAGVVLRLQSAARALEVIFMKENKNTDKVNSDKTQQVYGNESFGIPSDCTQKQKMSGIKLACYIVVVVLVCSAIYGSYRAATSYFLPEMTFDKSAQPILYIKSSDVALKTKADRKAKTVISSERFYKAADAEQYVTMTDDGRYIFYAVDNTENVSGFDLYCRRVSAIDADKEMPEEAVCVDSSVTEYKIHPEGQFVLYLKGNRLYFSNITDSHIVASDVTEFYLSKNNQQIVYFKDGGKMYTCGTGKKDKPVLIDSGIEKVLSEKDEYARIYYLKQGALFLKETGKEKICIAEDVLDGILLGDYVYFVKEEEQKMRFQEVFYDDKAVPDASIEAPLKSDFMTAGTDGKEIVDQTAFDDAVKRYEDKLLRDSIRNYFLLNPVTETKYNLYSVRRNDVKEIDSGLTDAFLNYNSCKQVIVYKKKVENFDKIKLSSIESIEDALEKVNQCRTAETDDCLQVLIKDKLPFLGLEEFPGGQIEISLDGKYLYCIENAGEDGRGTLVRYNITSKELKNRKELQQGVTDFALDGADSTVVAVFDGNKLGLCIDETYTHLSDNSCHSFFYVDGTLFFYADYDYGTESGSLKTFRDGKMKLIDVGVHEFDVRNLKTVTYIKHFNQEFGFGDLYLKNGSKKSRKIDICVRSILY